MTTFRIHHYIATLIVKLTAMQKLSIIAAIAAGMLMPSQMKAQQQMPQLPLDTAVVFGKLPNGLT